MFGTFYTNNAAFSCSPSPAVCPLPPSDTHWEMVVGGTVHRLRLQSYPVLWPAGHIATKVWRRREGQGQGGAGGRSWDRIRLVMIH